MASITNCSFHLLDLPLELRENIYSYYLKPADRLESSEEGGGGNYKFDNSLFLVNKQISDEARAVWKLQDAFFVMVRTPWPTTVHHISTEGFVPIVASGPRASLFKSHAFLVEITAPRYVAQAEHSIILLLDDIPRFTKTWYYSALSYPALNTELHVSFKVRPTGGWDANNPSTSQLDERHRSGVMQSRMLTPFEEVKNLDGIHFSDFAQTLTKQVLAGMRTPHPTLQQTLEKTASIIAEGDLLLFDSPSKPSEALVTYINAFHAMHIIIEGRTRRVLADNFFHDIVPTGRYKNQPGIQVRVLFRIQLVSRCVLAYLRLGELGEAAFWGMRTLRLMRDAMSSDFDDFLGPGGRGELGPISIRTAIAFALMEKTERPGYAGASYGRWREELAVYEDEDGTDSVKLWALAGKYSKDIGVEEKRKTALAEAEPFGVEVPEVFLRTEKPHNPK